MNHLHINGQLAEGIEVRIFYSASSRGVPETLYSVKVKGFGELGTHFSENAHLGYLCRGVVG